MRCLGVLLVLGGCVAADAPAASTAEPAEATEPEMRLRVVGEHGESQPAWPAKHDVFIAVVDALPADYAFRVIDVHGGELSLDEPACRRFHVGDGGQLELACHPAHGDRLQLAPFADAEPDAQGTMHFIVQVAPDGTSFDASSLKATFAVAAWPSS